MFIFSLNVLSREVYDLDRVVSRVSKIDSPNQLFVVVGVVVIEVVLLLLVAVVVVVLLLSAGGV